MVSSSKDTAQRATPTPSSFLRKWEEDIEREAIQNPNPIEYQVDPRLLITPPHNVSEYLANFPNMRLHGDGPRRGHGGCGVGYANGCGFGYNFYGCRGREARV